MNLENSERRKYARTKPPRLLYVRFGKENGGILLNASLHGFCFQATSPVQSSQPLDVTISRSPSSCINTRARIVWSSDDQNIGGLQFLDLTYGALSMLGEWLVEPSPAQSDAASPGSTPTLPAEFPLPGTSELRPTQPATPPSSPIPSLANRNETDDLLKGPLFVEDSKIRFPVLEPPVKTRTARTLFIVLALLAVSTAYILNSRTARHTLGSWLIDLGEYLNSDSATTNPPSSPAPSARPIEQPGSSPGESSDTRDPQVPPVTDRSDAPGNAPAESRGGPSALRLDAPNQSLSGRAGNSPTDTISQLWTAVARGDANAEVTLARRFLNGDGVNKNCEQARVLLVAASKRGNPEAIRELRKLLAHGCT